MMPHRPSRNFYVQRRLPQRYNRGLIACATIHCNTMAARPPCRRRNRWIDLPLKFHLEALFPSRLGSPLWRALAVTMTGMGATSKRKRGRPTSEFLGLYYFDFWRTRIRKRDGFIGNGIQPSQYCTRQSGSCDDNVRPPISDSCELSSFRLINLMNLNQTLI
jgi:hypothetical protein